MIDECLPPSLAARPNIAPRDQTIDQLVAERDYWQHRIDSAPGWGAGVGAAASFRDACVQELARRERASA